MRVAKFRLIWVGPAPGASVRSKILAHVWDYPHRSATQIARVLGADPGVISSYLAQAARLGVLTRVAGGGPRGGWTYAFPGRG